MIETLTTGDGLRLHLQRWPAPGPSHGTVQIVHGLGEHIGRYAALAETLNAAGWHVAGHDLRGHGPQRRAAGRHRRAVHAAGRSELGSRLPARRWPAHPAGPQPGRPDRGALRRRRADERGAALAARSRRAGAVVAGAAAAPVVAAAAGAAHRAAAGAGAARQQRAEPRWLSHDPEVARAYKADPLVHTRVTLQMVRTTVDQGPRRARPRRALAHADAADVGRADRCVAPGGSRLFADQAPTSIVTPVCFPRPVPRALQRERTRRGQVIESLTGWLARF